MTVLMSAVAVGVYFGLDYLPQDMVPGVGKHKEQAAAKPADEKPPVEDPVAPPAATDQSAVVTEEDLAEEPPPTQPEQAAAPGTVPSGTSTVDYDPPAGGAGVPVEEEETAAAAPAAAPEAAPAPAPEPEPEPAETPPPVEKPPVKVAKAPRADDSPSRPVKPAAPEADVIKPWWPDPATIPANQLKLQYAGQVQNEHAIALLFSSPLNLDTLKQHAEVRTSNGDPVTAGQWELAKNPRMAVLRGVKPGRYTVILAPTIADTSGFALGAKLQGPVYIQAQ
jgi:hypothetical protein